MTGEDIQQQDLVISKLLRQDISKYRSLFPHVSAAIQLGNNNNSKASNYPIKGDTIQYIYTNCRVVRIAENVVQTIEPLLGYAAETVLGIFEFDRTVYNSDGNGNFDKKNKARRRRIKWYEELREERMKDIRTEIS